MTMYRCPFPCPHKTEKTGDEVIERVKSDYVSFRYPEGVVLFHISKVKDMTGMRAVYVYKCTVYNFEGHECALTTLLSLLEK